MRAPSLPAEKLLSVAAGRWLIAVAAVIWSTSGAFTKVLTRPTFLYVEMPELSALQIAFFRALFAGLVLVPTLRGRDVSLQRPMLLMVACFAAMNALFVSALAFGTAANAIWLQYTAPLWMYVASVWWLGEPAERRTSQALVIALSGVAVIVWGGWRQAQLAVVSIALGSGVAYAGVMISLRRLRRASSRWLTLLNHLGSAAVLIPWVWQLPVPTPSQLGVLFLYGAVQMAIPYWLVARGLRVVATQEAGMITLLEPLLNPLWAYAVSPATESPDATTWSGGALILVGLVWRYAPRRNSIPEREPPFGKEARTEYKSIEPLRTTTLVDPGAPSMSQTPEEQLRKLGLELPAAPKPVGAYVAAIRAGNLAITSGQLPWKGNQLAYAGKLGSEVTVEQGYEAAKLAALNAIAQLKALVGDLDKVRQIVKLDGFVHSGPGFRQHPKVLDGASDLINAVFGERGRHTRTALGINEMPLDSPVQLVLWAEVD